MGDGCSFDAFVSKHGLDRDPAITTIAAIVRGADTGRHDLTPQSAGLLAISMGLRDVTPDDHEVLKYGVNIPSLRGIPSAKCPGLRNSRIRFFTREFARGGISVGNRRPSSTAPAFSHLSIIRRMTPSVTRWPRNVRR